MDGCEMPGNRQIPLLDTHNRWDTASVLGSYREMNVEQDQLVGRVFFSNTAEAESPYIKAREGHLTDFSVGYRVIESQWVDAGQKATIRGRSFVGPVRVTTRWRVKELSICPIGADEAAKARSNDQPNPPNHKEKKKMDPRLRAYLESRGLAEDADEAAAWAYLEKLRTQDVAAAAQPAATIRRRTPTATPQPVKATAPAIPTSTSTSCAARPWATNASVSSASMPSASGPAVKNWPAISSSEARPWTMCAKR